MKIRNFSTFVLAVSLYAPLFGAPIDSLAAARTTATLDSVRESRDLFIAGEFKQAETMLLASNTQKAETPEWDLESARLFVFVGFHLRNQGYSSFLPIASERAKYYLQDGQKKAASAAFISTVSALYETAGLISEKIDGDLAAAAANYQAALDVNPQAQGAKDELQRLSVLLAKMEARSQAAPRR